MTHACDRNGLSALTLCPGLCPAACSDPAGPRAPAAAAGLPWHPQPWVPCGSRTLLLLLPCRCRGDRCFLSPSREILPALPGAPKHSFWLPASPRSSSSHALLRSLRVARSEPRPWGSLGGCSGAPAAAGSLCKQPQRCSALAQLLGPMLAAWGVYVKVGAAA